MVATPRQREAVRKPRPYTWPVVAAGGGRGVIVRLLRGAGRVLRLPWRVVPYLAHPIQTVRMVRSADLQRNPHISKALSLSDGAQAMAFFRPCSARGPAARDRGACRPSRAGRCARGRGICGRVVPLAEQLTAAPTTRPAPRSTRDPSVHLTSRGRLLPSIVESLRADLHDQHVSISQRSPSAGSNWAGASSVNTATSFVPRRSTTPSASRAA